MVPEGRLRSAFFTSFGDTKSGELRIAARFSGLIFGKTKSNLRFSVPKVFVTGSLFGGHFLHGFLVMLVRLWMRLVEVLGSLVVVRVDTILERSSGEALTTLDTLSLGLVPSLVRTGDSLQVILSLRYFTLVLSMFDVVVKHVSCRLQIGDFSLLTFMVEMRRKVELFLEERLLGGDGGGFTAEGADRLW